MLGHQAYSSRRSTSQGCPLHRGVSTRMVPHFGRRQLFGGEISASEVSRILQAPGRRPCEQFSNRPLASYPVVNLDAQAT